MVTTSTDSNKKQSGPCTYVFGCAGCQNVELRPGHAELRYLRFEVWVYGFMALKVEGLLVQRVMLGCDEDVRCTAVEDYMAYSEVASGIANFSCRSREQQQLPSRQ